MAKSLLTFCLNSSYGVATDRKMVWVAFFKTAVFLGGKNTNKSYIPQKQKIIKCHMKGKMTFSIILFDNRKLNSINNTSNQVQSVEIIMNDKHESVYQQS